MNSMFYFYVSYICYDTLLIYHYFYYGITKQEMDKKFREVVKDVYADPNSRKILKKWIKKMETFAMTYDMFSIYEVMSKVKGRRYYGNFEFESEEDLQRIMNSDTITIRQLLFIVYVMTESIRDYFMKVMTGSLVEKFHKDSSVNRVLILDKMNKVIKQFGLHAGLYDDDILEVYTRLWNSIYPSHPSKRMVMQALSYPTSYEMIIDNWRDKNSRISRDYNHVLVHEVYPHKDDIIEDLSEEERRLFTNSNISLDNIDYLPYYTGCYMYRVGQLDNEESILSKMFKDKLLMTSISGSTILMMEIAKIFRIDLKYVFMLIVPFLYFPKDHSLFEIMYVAKNYFNERLLDYNYAFANQDRQMELNEKMAYINFVYNVLNEGYMPFAKSSSLMEDFVAKSKSKGEFVAKSKLEKQEGGLNPYTTQTYMTQKLSKKNERTLRNDIQRISKQDLMDGLNFKCLISTDDYINKRLREWQHIV